MRRKAAMKVHVRMAKVGAERHDMAGHGVALNLGMSMAT